MKTRLPAKAKGKLYKLDGGPWHGFEAYFTSDGGSLVFKVRGPEQFAGNGRPLVKREMFHGRYVNSGYSSAKWDYFN